MPAPQSEVIDPVEEVRVQFIKFVQRMAINNDMVKDVKWDVFADAITDRTLVNLWRKIPAVCGPDVQVPLTWWDHFKQRFFRGYLRNRFPICYRTYQARMYLPEFPIPTYEGPRIVSFPEVFRDDRTFEQRMRDASREEG